MTDDEHEYAVSLTTKLQEELKALVDERLKDELPVVEDLVRTLLSEQIRFWKDY